uniref:Cytokine receptor n=1 Tax=Strigamia maritima TaxID=126957 RepID=T1JBC3_STRMM
MYIWILLSFLISSLEGCSIYMQGIGSVSPHGDVKELVGSTVRIQCILNKTVMEAKGGGNVSGLIWSKDGTALPSKYVHVIDNYTNELVIPDATVENSGVYLCLLKNKTSTQYVCHNNVDVGYVPQNVSDFLCISPNWEYLECSFVRPFNPVKPTYTLQYRRNGVSSLSNCNMTQDKKRNMVFCNITAFSTPPYGQTVDKYYFTLSASNVLGDRTWSYMIEHYKQVKPNAPENINVTDLTSHSMTLTWSPPKLMVKFPPGLIYRVFYRSQWDLDDDWTLIESVEKLALNDLQPYTNFTFKIQAKSAVASDDFRLWSENATYSILTLPDVPTKPPNVSSSSFQERPFLNNRSVILFWQMIPLYQHNGKKFRYHVTGINGNQVIYPQNITENYAIFEGLMLEEAYAFRLTSVNEIGESINNSETLVPKKSELLIPPERFTVIYFGNGVYELSWRPTESQNVESDFTLYWCDNIKPHPFMCRGNLSWVHVTKEVRAYNLTLEDELKNYHFAVAANTHQRTSGIVWATCTIPYNGKINKMKTVKLASLTSTSIKVTWKLDCTERIGIVLGYKIYYCRTLSESIAAKCTGEQKEAFKNGSHAEEYLIGNLKPFHYYKITVAALTRAGEGEQSDGKFEITRQSSPVLTSEKLTVGGISNTSINVTWDEPENPNGIITKYIVEYNYRRIVISPVNRSTVIHGLMPFTNYTLSFIACNEAGCSNASHPIIETTAIGVPSMMSTPTISGVNATHVLTSFEDPVDPNGPISYYNLMVLVQTNEDNKTVEWFHNISSHEFLVSTRCEEPDFHTAVYSFAVEAVNIFHNSALVGPLSEPARYSCYSIRGPLVTTIIGIVAATIGAMFLVIMFVCIYVRFRAKYREIQNIKIYLPKGLESNDYKSSSCDFNSIQTYPNLKTNGWIKASNNKMANGNARQRSTSGETRLSVTSMDELLQRHADGRTDQQPPCETSSGLSSLSSVQTTRSNLSSESSDSLPPTTPDAVFPENPLANIHKLLMPSATLEVLPEASPPANYSHFGRSFEVPNGGYLPIVGRNPQDGGYVLPSDPPPPSTSYSQLGIAEQNPYMNYLAGDTAPVPAAYCQIAAAPQAQPEPFRRFNNGYVSAEAPKMPVDANKCPPTATTAETEDLPVEYSRLSFHDPKSSTGYVALPDVTHLLNNDISSNANPEKPVVGHYVSLDVVEDANEQPNNFLEIKPLDDVMKSSTTSDDMMKSSLYSDAAMKSSLTSEDAMKSSIISEDAMKSSMTSDNAMKSSMTSEDAMKSSLTSDGYDSPGPYSRVVSMTFDESDTKES